MLNRKVTGNPMAKRSQKYICRSLTELMQKKPYKKITITEICNNAQLVRETFYRNFSSKDAVIKSCIEEKFQHFIQSIDFRSENLSIYNTALAYFTFWEKQKEFLKLLISNNLVNLVLDQFSEQFDLIGDYIINEKETKEARNYIIAIYAGATINLLIKWILNDCKEPPEEMARIINEYSPL